MEIRTMPLGSYQTNCYLVWNQGADSCVVIDPGYQPEQVLEAALDAGKKIEAIFLTHGHFDHVGGVKQVARETGCRVYICEEDLLLNPRLTDGAIYYTDTYDEADAVTAAGLTFRVLRTPGHTPGSVCLVCENAIFSGDTLFCGTCGRTDLPGGSGAQMRASLARLAGLEGDYRVLPGHGEDSTLDMERRSNPFMQRL